MIHQHFSLDLQLEYDVELVLAKVKSNLRSHKAEFAKAVKVYHKKMVEVLEAKLAAAREVRQIKHHIDLPIPQSFEKAYEMAIEMLSHCDSETVKLDRTSYAQLMLDQWDFKERFVGTMSFYNSSPEHIKGEDYV